MILTAILPSLGHSLVSEWLNTQMRHS